MVTPIVAPLPGFTSLSQTNPRKLHNHRKVNSLEYGRSIVTIVANDALHYDKVKQIDCTYL